MTSSRIKLGGARIRPGYVVAIVALAIIGAGAKFFWLDGSTYWRVTTDVPPGTALTAAVLQKVQLNLGQAGGNYLTGSLPHGYTVSGLREGDLIARSQVSQQSPGEQVRVVITSKTELAKTVRGGAQVDIWAARKNQNEFDPPVLLVPSAGVVGLVEQKGMFASNHQQVEVQVSAADAPLLLDALATDSAIFVVPLQ